jgi:predicted aldo/keto reductase-like oxidoreductase
MKLRDFGQRNGLQVASVSIGAMRLPRDVTDAVALVRHAIDSGMCYIDTSRGYGESEFVLSRALKDGYRDKVILSTKWSPWITKIRQDDDTSAERTLQRIKESITRLDVEYLDYYQVWNIDSKEHYDQAIEPGGMLDGIRAAQKEGLVKRTGFTTHDSVENLLTYIEEADWCDIILFTYNAFNLQYAPAIEAAHKKGIGTIVMNPMGGGNLAEESPILSKLAEESGTESMPNLAIRYVLSNPNVDTILCGITKQSDVDDTIASAGKPKFTPEQVAAIDEKVKALSSENVGFCTKCKYCMPCPQGINIPAVMNAIYEYRFLGRKKYAQRLYNWIKEAKANSCTKCGECEEKCTQHLKIMDEMVFAAETFSSE